MEEKDRRKKGRKERREGGKTREEEKALPEFKQNIFNPVRIEFLFVLLCHDSAAFQKMP